MSRWKGEKPIPMKVQREFVTAFSLLPVMRTDLRVPVNGLVTVSDASMGRGAVCRAVTLRPAGIRAALSSAASSATRAIDEVALVSLFLRRRWSQEGNGTDRSTSKRLLQR